MTAPFGERLADAVAARGPLCVGIDPHASLLDKWGLPDSAGGLARFTDAVVDALAGTVAVLKPQLAFPLALLLVLLDSGNMRSYLVGFVSATAALAGHDLLRLHRPPGRSAGQPGRLPDRAGARLCHQRARREPLRP